MELQTAVVWVGVAIVAAAVLLLVSLFGSSRTSYEEARAEQRRAATELLALAGNATKPKKSKKQGKKAKEKKHKEVPQTGSERDSDAAGADSGQEEEATPAAPAAHAPRPHVEFGESTVLDALPDKSAKAQIRKRGKEPKIKPILVNKEDAGCASEPVTPPALSNNFEEIHPKDEFEMLHATLPSDQAEKKEEIVEKKETKPVKGGKGKHGRQSAAAPPAAAVTHAPPPVAPLAAPAAASEPPQKERHNSGDSAKEQRKTKKNERRHLVDETGDKLAVEATVPPLNLVSQPSELTTDKILKPVPPHAPVAAAPTPASAAPAPAPTKGKKNKKNEPTVMTLVAGDDGGVNVGELVRLVSEASLSRTEIQILTDALLNKQHGPLPQHSEWTEGPNDPVQKLKKQLAEKEKALTDEQEASQAVHAKLKELRLSLNVERSRANAATRAAEDAVAAHKVEVHTLQTRMQRLLDDNHALSQDKLLLQSKLSAEGESQAQRLQLEMHIAGQAEAEAALVQQLGALQAEVTARAHEAQQARCEAAAAREATHHVQQQAADLAQQLQGCKIKEANRVSAELAASAELRAATERAAELQAEVQRLHATGLQAERAREDAERQSRQLSSEMKSLREQLVAKEEEIKKEHESHRQNGLPLQEDNQKKVELRNVENALEGLRAELAATQSSHAEQTKQLQSLQQQLQQYKDKNNELRTKNWKVVDALTAAEKALQAKSTGPAPASASANEALAKALEQQQRETAEVLRAACPQAAPAGAPGREWLAAFAAQLETVLRAAAAPAAAATPAAPAAPAAAELQAQNKRLQELVDKYKRIIDDTEGALSQLQQNVTSAEQRWARLLQDKQRELDRLQQTTVTQEPLAFAYSCIEKSLPAIVSEMQSKIDALQVELERSRAIRTHTLADAERGNEENTRLLISEKYQIESSNGPSQVGLEEK